MPYIKKEYGSRHVNRKVGFEVSVNFSLPFFNCVWQEDFYCQQVETLAKPNSNTLSYYLQFDYSLTL